MFFRLICISLVVTIGFTTMGCSRSSDVPKVSDADKKPQDMVKDALNIGIESNPTNLDPRFATDASSSRMDQLIFSSLVKLDANSEPVGDLAERWEIKNGKQYIFYLKKGVKFHDGSNLTSKDVKGTFLSIMSDKNNSPYKKVYSDIIDNIDIIDNHTVSFNLKKVHAPFIVDMVFPIIPSANGISPDFPKKLIGSGPFRFVGFKQDDHIKLSANKDYYGGAPSINSLNFRIIPENNVRVLEIKKGGLDLVQNDITPDLLAMLESEHKLAISKEPGTNYTYIGFNMKNATTGNKLVRRAIAYSIDKQLIIKTVLKSQAAASTGLLSPANWAYNKNIAHYEYNIKKAKELLDRAGYPDPDGDGPGTRFDLQFKTSQNELANRVAEVIQAELANVGINVTINRYEWGTFYNFIKKGDFQLYTLTWVGISEPDIYYNVFHTGSTPPNGANRGRYSNKTVDALLEAARVSIDNKVRKEKYGEVQKIIADELPYISLWHPLNIVVANKKIKGYKLYPSGSMISLKDVTWDR